MKPSLRRGVVVACALTVGLAVSAPSFAANDVLDDQTSLWTNPQSSTKQAAVALKGQAKRDALTLSRYPSATWFTGSSPEQVGADVARLVERSDEKVPVLVAYNIPFRDCAQFSAGGATSVAEYTAWIDAFAAGIGDAEAVVILEPDGLGIIPWYTTLNGELEWCRPDEADPASAADERFAMLNHAVDALKANPNTVVYLDGTHSGWLGVGDAADRLDKAGVERADGFYLNASNYHYTTNQVFYGTWISQCLAQGDYANCANQYWNGGPLPAKIAELLGEWNGVALSPYGEWSEESDDPALNVSGYPYRFWGEPTTHFVVDTSRNGLGPWDWATAGYSDSGSAQDWCNPPDRGLGIKPTTHTGNDLVDAYLWIKIPGESDGQCFRDGSLGALDPERGMLDPPAGAWFPEQARELIDLAVDPVSRSGK
jgi:endoglucanase